MNTGAESYRRFLKGDNSGLAEIIKEYKDGLVFYVNGMVGNIRTAEELTEDTFVKLGTRKPKYNASNASFKTWLYTIARNTALDYMRKCARNSDVSIDDCHFLADEENLERSYILEERKITVHRAIKRLAPQYRQILWLVYFENFSIKEAAEVMKKSVHSTETLVYRARLALKSELEKEDFVYEELQ